jgi:hypothetical protein
VARVYDAGSAQGIWEWRRVRFGLRPPPRTLALTEISRLRHSVDALSKGGVNGDLEAPNPRCAYMKKVALIEKEKSRSYTLLIFNFAREDGLYTMTAKETPVKYTALRHCQRGELFPTGALLS